MSEQQCISFPADGFIPSSFFRRTMTVAQLCDLLG